MAASSAKPDAGVPFGRYLLRERLARGGMGEVFRAVAVGASGFEKPVVVKRILPQLQSEQRLATMFVDEARLMSRLAHPNIVQVIDFGQGAEQDYFLVLELVEGVDLGQLRSFYQGRHEWVPIPLALYVVQQMLRGLGHAHEKAYDDGRVLVHRDVSPGNVLLWVGEVKIGDFGVALAGEPDGGAGNDRLVVGKLGYMAPEQHAGEAVDPRADLFSVAVVLFELLTHDRPFAGETPTQRLAAAARGQCRSAAQLREEISPELDAVMAKALRRSPEERFRSARAMALALEELRDVNQTFAGADDLAEAVERAQAASSQRAKPVVVLGADLGGEQTPVRELTRTGAARFTMSIVEPRAGATSRADAPSAGAAGAYEPSAPPRDRAVDRTRPTVAGGNIPVRGKASARVWRTAPFRVLVVVAVIAIGSAALWLAWQTSSDHSTALDGPTDPSPSGAPLLPVASFTEAPGGPASASPPSATPDADSGTAADRDPAARSTSTSRPRGAGGSAAATGATADAPQVAPSTGASASAATAAPPVAVCQGEVHLYASHGWTVSGGPSAVQAPGRYRWPCGGYTLRASSRLDPTESRQLSVTVQPSQTAVVDLRR